MLSNPACSHVLRFTNSALLIPDQSGFSTPSRTEPSQILFSVHRRMTYRRLNLALAFVSLLGGCLTVGPHQAQADVNVAHAKVSKVQAQGLGFWVLQRWSCSALAKIARFWGRTDPKSKPVIGEPPVDRYASTPSPSIRVLHVDTLNATSLHRRASNREGSLADYHLAATEHMPGEGKKAAGSRKHVSCRLHRFWLAAAAWFAPSFAVGSWGSRGPARG